MQAWFQHQSQGNQLEIQARLCGPLWACNLRSVPFMGSRKSCFFAFGFRLSPSKRGTLKRRHFQMYGMPEDTLGPFFFGPTPMTVSILQAASQSRFAGAVRRKKDTMWPGKYPPKDPQIRTPSAGVVDWTGSFPFDFPSNQPERVPASNKHRLMS